MAEQETRTTWNHRIVKSVDEDGGEFFSIQEVYYEDTTPTAHTIELGVEGESVEDLKETLTNMLACLEKPILDEIPMEESEEYFDDEDIDDENDDLTEDDFGTESDDSDSDEESDPANKK
mgnify:CR=1 FL=1